MAVHLVVDKSAKFLEWEDLLGNRYPIDECPTEQEDLDLLRAEHGTIMSERLLKRTALRQKIMKSDTLDELKECLVRILAERV